MLSIRRSLDSPQPERHGVHIYDHESKRWVHLGGMSDYQAKLISDNLPLQTLTVTVGPYNERVIL